MSQWEPQPRQALFLKSCAYEAGYGGAKGGGKTDALLADAVSQITNPRYKAIIFRRTYPKLQEIIDRSMRLFNGYAKWAGDRHRWTFPTGATLTFAHCQNEADKYNYQGQEYHFIGFDQLEEFTQSIYEFLIAQNRTSDPSIKCYIRATFNPGNIGHAWVKARFVDLLQPDGQVRYFRRAGEKDTQCDKHDEGAMSRAFIFAKVHDNQILLKSDPQYISRLQILPEATRRALLEGDWDAFEGQYFKEWDRTIHVIPYREYSEMARSLPVSRFIASDYGFKNPSSTGWYAVFPDGQIIRYREMYKTGLTYEQLAEDVLKMTPQSEKIDYWTCDPAIQGDKSHHKEAKDGEARGRSGYDILCEKVAGRFPVLLADNRRVVGWTRLHELLEVYQDQFDKKNALLRITDNCLQLIRTLPTMVFDDSNPEDLNTDGEDHAVDELRYAVMSRQIVPKNMPVAPTPKDEFWQAVRSDMKPFQQENDENEGSLLVEDDYVLQEN